jgi:hypothetical protein
MADVRQFIIYCWTCGAPVKIDRDCEPCKYNRAYCLGKEIPECVAGTCFCSISCEFKAHYDNKQTWENEEL